MSRIFCVIPAYNEEKNIVKVIRDVLGYVEKIVVVDDCSSDNTVNVVRLANFDEDVVILRHSVNRGQGAALETGNGYARRHNADIVVHFDADGQFVASEIPELVRPVIANEAEVVFGSRFSTKKSNIPRFKKSVILPIGKMVNRLLIGKNDLTDPQSGFRVFGKKALGNVIIEQDRMAHCSEILNKVIKAKYNVKEIPITVIYHEFGQRLGGGVDIVKDLIIKRIMGGV